MTDRTPNVPDGYEPVADWHPEPRLCERVLRCSSSEVAALLDRGAIRRAGDGRVDLDSLTSFADETGLCPSKHVRAALAVPRDARTWQTSALADLLGFSPDVVRRMIDRGEIEAYRLPGGARLVSREALIDYLSRNPGRVAPSMGLRSTGHAPRPRPRKVTTQGRS